VGAAALSLPVGYVDPSSINSKLASGDSVSLRALRRGIPVINLINIRTIAMENAQYFRSTVEETAWLSHVRWSGVQRLLAALAALSAIAACFFVQLRSKHCNYQPQGEPSDV
jgi:hypothetical protein